MARTGTPLHLAVLLATSAAVLPCEGSWAAHPRIAIVSTVPAATAPVPSQAYANAFAAVGFPVSWVTPENATRLQDTVLVVPGPEAARLAAARLPALVSFVLRGGRLITAGDTPLSRALDIHFPDRDLPAIGAEDTLAPDLEITWRTPATLRAFQPPEGARVLTLARGTVQPLVVGFTLGRGAVLFLGVDLDEDDARGYGRFPMFLADACEALDVAPFVSVPRLAAYVDLADRRSGEWEGLARSWHDAGIREVHLGAWDAFDRPAEAVRALIDACHRVGIRVIARLALPEVSDGFWRDHPRWRERTATGDDAVVNGRKLMALDIPECFEAVSQGLAQMFQRFEWDGIEIGGLAYESARGPEAPAQFTPLNDHVREVFAGLSGFDPLSLFRRGSDRYWRSNPASFDLFLAFRRDLIVDLHARVLALLKEIGSQGGGTDIVVTLADVLSEPKLRDFLAVDPERISALGRRFRFRLQVEDPPSMRSQGPERYSRIAELFGPLWPPPRQLGIDVQVVPREGLTFPTAQPTGLELIQLLAEAARHFSFVTVDSAATVRDADRAWLAHALAAGVDVQTGPGRGLEVTTATTAEVDLGVEARHVSLDGRAWPAVRGRVAIVPRGRHRLTWRPGATPASALRLLEVNGTLLGAEEHGGRLLVRYLADGPAFLTVSFRPRTARVDGRESSLEAIRAEGGFVVRAPAGDHTLILAR
ncbi:MAG: hypothetical protein ACM3O7_08245 [Acidobacteriota bacterium]